MSIARLLCVPRITWLRVQVVIAGLLGRFYSNQMPTDVSIVVVVFVCLFVSGHAWSWGAHCEAGLLTMKLSAMRLWQHPALKSRLRHHALPWVLVAKGTGWKCQTGAPWDPCNTSNRCLPPGHR